jgi:hypothetical protein
MNTPKRIKNPVFLTFLVLSYFFLLGSSCGGDKKNTNEPAAPIGETGEELDWQKVQLSKEEMEEFNEGKTEMEPSEGKSAAASSAPATTSSGTGTGPGTLKIVLKALGQEVVGDVRIKNTATDSDVEKAGGKSTYVFTLNKGTYKIDAIFHDAIDEPRLTLQDVEIPAGGKVERTFNFPMAQVKFIPVKSGTNSIVSGYKLRLKSLGAEEWFSKSVNTGKEFYYISPGNYEGQLFKGAKKHEKTIDIPSIQINEGSKAQKRIDVSM